MLSSSAVRKAAKPLGDRAATLSQPTILSTGSDRRFGNPWAGFEDKGLWDVFKYFRNRPKAPASGILIDVAKPSPADFERAFPLVPPNYAALSNPPGNAVQATWLGHASCLVQMEGVSFLTDPIFSQRCSPVQWFGTKRVVQPALKLDDPKLPHIDFVVISHNHYDHLDYNSVRQLHQRYGDKLAWYVPLGLAAWFKAMNIANVHEMSWWDEMQHPQSSVTLACVPAQHWSSRKGNSDENKSLWCGWAVLGNAHKFWFAGDTGYCDTFKEIGQQYGPFDLSAIPIGAYKPRWFMKSQHVDPEEAIKIHQDASSKRSISIHCCTFNLTEEPLDEPPKRLCKAAQAAGMASNAFVTLQHGAMLQTANGTDLNRPPLLS